MHCARRRLCEQLFGERKILCRGSPVIHVGKLQRSFERLLRVLRRLCCKRHRSEHDRAVRRIKPRSIPVKFARAPSRMPVAEAIRMWRLFGISDERPDFSCSTGTDPRHALRTL